MPALYNDAVKIFTTVFLELNEEQQIDVSEFSCENIQQWEHGLRIIKFLKQVSKLFFFKVLVVFDVFFFIRNQVLKV